MSIVEAYSVGTPVICGDFGNAGDIVVNGVTGWKFAGLDELIDCVRKIGREDLSLKTYQEYSSNYTEQINYNTMTKIYESLL